MRKSTRYFTTSFTANSLSAKRVTSFSWYLCISLVNVCMVFLKVSAMFFVVIGRTSRKACFLPKRKRVAWPSPHVVPLVGLVLVSIVLSLWYWGIVWKSIATLFSLVSLRVFLPSPCIVCLTFSGERFFSPFKVFLPWFPSLVR